MMSSELRGSSLIAYWIHQYPFGITAIDSHCPGVDKATVTAGKLKNLLVGVDGEWLVIVKFGIFTHK